MAEYKAIDLHLHTKVSDGTDSPEEILGKVRSAGIELFSVTDHDAFKACEEIQRIRRDDDPRFIPGIEFSCKDELGKYHILGYAYDRNAPEIREAVATGHAYRITKTGERLEALKKQYGIIFSEKDIRELYANDNPGKPHIVELMVKYGYARSIPQAFHDVLNSIRVKSSYIRPEVAVRAILSGGGIPVLAHPSYGSGEEKIFGDDMDERLRRLIGFGIQGLEAYYSGFDDSIRSELLAFSEKYDLYVTAGSDYHGTKKDVRLGETHLPDAGMAHPNLHRFLDAITDRIS